jgi:hypothetical protein
MAATISDSSVSVKSLMRFLRPVASIKPLKREENWNDIINLSVRL